jgi:hypothetical protein
MLGFYCQGISLGKLGFFFFFFFLLWDWVCYSANLDLWVINFETSRTFAVFGCCGNVGK